ncbi:MAG: hypothetical protein CMF62_08375 [Magnetococcales bacterium]|nr:hypothetical protein [Magnetococcales bacterium]
MVNIVDVMLKDQVVSLRDLQSLPVTVQKNPDTLIESLAKSGKLSETQQSRYRALAYEYPLRSAEDMARITPHQIEGINRDFMVRYTACPIELGRGQVLWVAADLPNKRLVSEIILRNRRNKHDFVWAPAKAIEDAIERMSKQEGHSLKFLVENAYAQINTGNDDTIIGLTDEIIRTAYKNGASDLHIGIVNRKPSCMARFDGQLEELVALPIEVYERVLGRLRHMAGVRAENYKKPMNGRMTFELSGREKIDIRYASQPISLENTASIALRFLRPFEGSIDTFGYTQNTIDRIDHLMRMDEGVILFAGPTGSGKSTAARLMLRRAHRPGQKMIAYEDQIEERMDNVIQSEGDPTVGFTLESFIENVVLRGDPNVVYIGEVRSPEDTRRTVDAGNLGRLVVSTIHANDSFMTLDRLLQRGVQPEQIFTNIRGVIAQRLLRRLCSRCKIAHELTDEELKNLNNLKRIEFKKGDVIHQHNVNGCDHCHYRGFLGRIAIEEVLEMRRELTRDVWTGTSLRPDWIDVIREESQKLGMEDMLSHGLRHVKNGITNMEELERYFSAELENASGK